MFAMLTNLEIGLGFFLLATVVLLFCSYNANKMWEQRYGQLKREYDRTSRQLHDVQSELRTRTNELARYKTSFNSLNKSINDRFVRESAKVKPIAQVPDNFRTYFSPERAPAQQNIDNTDHWAGMPLWVNPMQPQDPVHHSVSPDPTPVKLDSNYSNDCSPTDSGSSHSHSSSSHDSGSSYSCDSSPSINTD